MKLQEYKRIDISKDQILPTAERMRKDHGIKVCEFLDAETAAAVLFGIDHLKAAG